MHKIICKHKQAYISTTIYQYTAENILEKTYFVFAILGMFLLPKVLYATQECKRVWPNYKRSYININKHSHIR